jgi:AraC-like DNA-binding protein
MRAPLDRYQLIHSSDLGEIQDALRNAIGIELSRRCSPPTELTATVNHLKMKGFSLTYCSFSGPASLQFPASESFLQVFNIDGAGRLLASPPENIAGEDSTSVVSLSAPASIEYSEPFKHFALHIDSSSLMQHLRLLVDRETSQPLVFRRDGDRAGMVVSVLRRGLFNFAFDINLRGALLSTAAAAEVERMIIMSFLLCNHSNYTPLMSVGPAPEVSSIVQQVEQYIDRNWDQPIDTAALAVIAKVSERSLFRQFALLRGYTPHGYIKRIRLQRAFDALSHPREGATVTQIALRCGFQNVGHFAHDYRLAFGELPSQTLARARQIS